LDTDDIDEAKDLIWSAALSLEKAMNSVDNSKSLKNQLTSNQSLHTVLSEKLQLNSMLGINAS
jgi:hypothetical protein